MALDTITASTRQGTTTVEPSRAWILGLVVEPDGSVTGPAAEPVIDWPSGGPSDGALDEPEAP